MRNNIQKQVSQYLVSCIDGSGYDVETETEQQKKDFIKDSFWSEYGWNVNQAGLQKACQSYLQGLPSGCTLEFWNDKIIEILKTWGVVKPTMRQETQEKKVDEYWNRMAYELSKIVKKD